MFPVPEGIMRLNGCRLEVHPKIQMPDCRTLISEHQILLVKTTQAAFPTPPIWPVQVFHWGATLKVSDHQGTACFHRTGSYCPYEGVLPMLFSTTKVPECTCEHCSILFSQIPIFNCNSSNIILQWGDLLNNLKSLLQTQCQHECFAGRPALQADQLKPKKWINMPGSHDGVRQSRFPGTQPPALKAGLTASVLPGDINFHPTLHSILSIPAFTVTTACLYISSIVVDVMAT